MNFSKKIDMLMSENNIKNLRQLANEVNIPYTTLWDYYSNPVRLEKANLTYIKRIARHLNCTVDYLAYDEITDSEENEFSKSELMNKQNNDKSKVDELDIIYNKYKYLLNEDDKETMKFLLLKRAKDINKN